MTQIASTNIDTPGSENAWLGEQLAIFLFLFFSSLPFQFLVEKIRITQNKKSLALDAIIKFFKVTIIYTDSVQLGSVLLGSA